MKILTINIGSSSVKYAVFNVVDQFLLESSGTYRQSSQASASSYRWQHQNYCRNLNESDELQFDTVPDILAHLSHFIFDRNATDITIIAYRLVHGGEIFTKPTLIDHSQLSLLQEVDSMAPIHNRHCINAMRFFLEKQPKLFHILIPDTSFHQTLPEYASTYAIPEHWRELGIKRYGFHGLSHQYVAEKVALQQGKTGSAINIISCHLGSGSSICAIKNGQSIDTSMGFSPLEGLVMGSRSGSIDAAIFSYLNRKLNLSINEIEDVLYRESGLLGLAGTQDIELLEQQCQRGDRASILAFDLFIYQIKKMIGAYFAVLGRVDYLVFTGGIGENSAKVRATIVDALTGFSLLLNHDSNNNIQAGEQICSMIHSSQSKVKIALIQTNEEYMLARESYRLSELLF